MRAIYTLCISLTLGLSAADKICPETSLNNTYPVFGALNYVQRGVWIQIPCLSIRSQEEALSRVVWSKKNSTETTPETLITYKRNKDHPESERYAFGASGYSLIIKGVKVADEGRYFCSVAPSETPQRVEEIDIKVIGESFPASTSDVSSRASFQRGQRQMVPCQCASQSPDAPSVVYWSTGEGVTTDTEIIGARFSDGTTLQIQHGADYSIGSDASLTVNSFNDLKDIQRFWCHVFQSDGTLRNCYTDVDKHVTDGKIRPDDALKASETSFYLQEGLRQILPCIGWISGTATCKVQWQKLDTSYQVILNYNLSTNRTDEVTGYYLASDFGLGITSVEDSHTGRYKCISAYTNKVEEIEVRVAGNRFPLDGGNAVAHKLMYFKPGINLTLTFPADFNTSLTTDALIIWSYGKPEEENTTVIGQLSLPDGTKTLSDLKDEGCFDITSEGSLILNNCSQDGDVRYWCHIFLYGEKVIRTYVDSKIKDSAGNPGSSCIIPVIVCVVVIVLLIIVGVVVWRQRGKRCTECRKMKQEPVRHYDASKIAEEIKAFVKNNFGQIPITPWATGGDADKAPMDKVYIPTEMFLNVPFADGCVRCKLLSESQLFDDGISKLANRHVLISGKSGCGKTTILGRVIYDWSLGKKDTLLAEKKLVFLLPAGLLTQTRNLGQAVVQHMLPSHPATLATFINEYCSNNPSDVAILVDGCNGKQDIATVMRISEDQGLLECHLIMTTRNANIAQDACKDNNMRSVTISGFAPDNVCKYVENILDIVCDNSSTRTTTQTGTVINVKDSLPRTSLEAVQEMKDEQNTVISSTPSNKKNPSEQKIMPEGESSRSDERKNVIDDTLTQTQPNDTQQKTLTERDKVSPNFQKYLKEGILPPEVVCLPGNLAALCQLCVWTNGGAFDSANTMSDIFYKLVKCLFERGKVTNGDKSVKDDESLERKEDEEASIGIGSRLETLTKRQLLIVTELGKVVQSKISEHYEGPVALSESDFLSTDGEKDILEAAIKTGLLCRGTEARNRDLDTDSPERISKARNTGSFLCCRKQVPNENDVEEPLVRRNTEVHFALEIIEQFCVGVHMAHSTVSIAKWLKSVSLEIGFKNDFDKIVRLIIFACRNNQHYERPAVIKQLNEGRSTSNPKHVYRVQKLLELGLELNFNGIGTLNQTLSENIRLIGVSTHKIRLLTYFLQNANQSNKDGSAVKVKSIELFRIDLSQCSDGQDILANYAQEFEGKTSQADKEQQTESNNQLLEEIRSSRLSMSVSPVNQSGRLLDICQLSVLQELLESQSGECYSCSAAEDLATQLKNMKMLQKIILVGTILSSQNICSLVEIPTNLMKLTTLDLCLNERFDNRAFEAIANSLHAFTKLTDLRLSLLKVNKDGFRKVSLKMEKDGGKGWERLKTLHLLHGSPAKHFWEFFSISVKYLRDVVSIHISASSSKCKLPNDVILEAKKNLLNPGYVKQIKNLDISNMDKLKSEVGIESPKDIIRVKRNCPNVDDAGDV